MSSDTDKWYTPAAVVRAAVADTVDSPLEVDAEMRHLLAALHAA